MPKPTSSEWCSAAPKPSSGMARLQTPSSASGEGRSVNILASTSGTAGVACRDGLMPRLSTTPPWVIRNRGWLCRARKRRVGERCGSRRAPRDWRRRPARNRHGEQHTRRPTRAQGSRTSGRNASMRTGRCAARSRRGRGRPGRPRLAKRGRRWDRGNVGWGAGEGRLG